MQHATWFTNSIAVCACNQQEYYRSHITIHTEGNMNCLSTFALQLLSMWALLIVITITYPQLIVLSTWCRAVSLGIYHRWWPMLARILTATLKLLLLEGLLSCRTDEALSYLNQCGLLITKILIFFFFQALYGALVHRTRSHFMVELWWNSTVYLQWLISITNR